MLRKFEPLRLLWPEPIFAPNVWWIRLAFCISLYGNCLLYTSISESGNISNLSVETISSLHIWRQINPRWINGHLWLNYLSLRWLQPKQAISFWHSYLPNSFNNALYLHNCHKSSYSRNFCLFFNESGYFLSTIYKDLASKEGLYIVLYLSGLNLMEGELTIEQYNTCNCTIFFSIILTSK